MIGFSRPGMEDVEVDSIPGTLKTGGGHSDKGDMLAPACRTALAANGSCEVAIDKDSFSVQKALALVSPPGPGTSEVSGDASSSGALIDLSLDSQGGILCASISWKGSKGGSL